MTPSERFLSWYPDYPQWKEQVFDHYGRRCRCCGQTWDLSIDHINGDGKAHRAAIGQRKLYRWLIQNNFPSDYQTLCRPCNSSKSTGPYCRKHRR